MKVLMIINGISPTKKKKLLKFFSSFTNRQADSLSRLGLEIDYIYSGRLCLSQIVKLFFRLLYKKIKIKPDIIHAQYGGLMGFLSALIHGKSSLVVSFCGSDLLGSYKSNGKKTLKSRVAIKLSKVAAIYASGIIVKSKELMEALPNHCKSKARVIPNGVDLNLFYPADQSEARRKLKLPLNKKIILFNRGSDDFIKNLRLAQDAFKLLQKRQKNAMFFLMQNEFPESVPLLMNACDVLLLTSQHEGSPNVVKEALACNLPVVSVPSGDVRKRLDGVSLSYVVDYSPKALADALNKVLEIGKRSNGREKVQNLSIEKVAEKIRDFYFQIIKGSQL